MSERRILGLAILAIGIVLIVFGVTATHGMNEELSKAVTGKYTDETMWYIIGGIFLVVIGGGMSLLRRGR